MTTNTPMPTATCPRCTYEWQPRVPDPKVCPRCQYKLHPFSLREKG